MERSILHVDMNAYYASVEEVQNPSLRWRPMAVGGEEALRHGIILAKNQKAKVAGVRTGETLWEARQKCPSLLIVKPHFQLYRRYSEAAMQIYQDYSDRVESFGLDEVWLDVSGENAWERAHEIRRRVRRELGLTVSVGVSWCKVFAKLGSDMKKPDAVTEISRENYRDCVWPLPVQNLLYVGPAATRRLLRLGVRSIGDLAALPVDFLQEQFGADGLRLHRFANGEDRSEVRRTAEMPAAKSIGNSVTCPRDLQTFDEIAVVLLDLSDRVAFRLRQSGLTAGGLSCMFRDKQFRLMERQTSISQATDASGEIYATACRLLRRILPAEEGLAVRSLGVRAFRTEARGARQLSYLPEEERLDKERRLCASLDQIRQRYGFSAVRRAALLRTGARFPSSALPLSGTPS